ncbi:MAG: hypothetical protein KKE23_00495 [Nanoarchaeota archaeon]|nr:hypothetical protein [Nanoarchaeota archaeon]
MFEIESNLNKKRVIERITIIIKTFFKWGSILASLFKSIKETARSNTIIDGARSRYFIGIMLLKKNPTIPILKLEREYFMIRESSKKKEFTEKMNRFIKNSA